MKINLSYRVDKRIKVVELKTGNTAFLVELDDFVLVTEINDFTEEIAGKVLLSVEDYNKLRKERLTNARPHSFRFRRAET